MANYNAPSNMENNEAILRDVLAGLMTRYRQRVPDVSKITGAMINEKLIVAPEDIENDHIAFRSLAVPNLGISSLEKIFLHYGYTKRDYYFFKEKKLNAWWYSPPAAGLPRIFISELRVTDLSDEAQKIIYSYTNKVTTDPVAQLDLSVAAEVINYLHSSSWSLPSMSDYEFLASESEYAAWAIYNRYYLNHFTMSVHNLPMGYNTLEAFNNFLEKNNVQLNDAGGKIKKSPDGLLLQSSTVARMVAAVFSDGEKKNIPGSYVEFAERKPIEQYKSVPARDVLPIHRREGFEAANADKIFESTYLEQINKKRE